MKFKLFTNDRHPAKDGTPLYSCYRDIEAVSKKAARAFVPAQFDAPGYAPAVAIEWPPANAADKEWLVKHVGTPGMVSELAEQRR